MSDQVLMSNFESMELYVTAIASGSNGNCYYIGNQQEAVLIDAGISCRETEQRMKRLGLSMQKVQAIFISHEHTDHIRGVVRIAKKYQLPVYITPRTLNNIPLDLPPANTIRLMPHVAVRKGNLSITAFPKKHDASDPQSFVITNGATTVGVMTDIGKPCEQVIQHFSQCQAVFLETNYDDLMLAEGPYPYYLKRRVSSDIGHLSNQQAYELFIRHRAANLSHIFLSHISKDNNRPEKVRDLFLSNAGDTEIILTSRHQETPVYTICSDKTISRPRFIQQNLFE